MGHILDETVARVANSDALEVKEAQLRLLARRLGVDYDEL